MAALIGFGVGWLCGAGYTLWRRRITRRTYARVYARLVRLGWPASAAREGATVWHNVGLRLQERGTRLTNVRGPR